MPAAHAPAHGDHSIREEIANALTHGLGATAALLADETPPPYIETAMADGWLTIPEGVGYPVTRMSVDAARRL